MVREHSPCDIRRMGSAFLLVIGIYVFLAHPNMPPKQRCTVQASSEKTVKYMATIYVNISLPK